MRRIFVIALANFAVVGLVLVAAIGNIASACSASEGCGGAPPLAWFGIGLALVAALGVFVAMRRWARATRDTESVKVGSFARGKSTEVDPPTITGEEMESRSRDRLGRITNAVHEAVDDDEAGSDVMACDIQFLPESEAAGESNMPVTEPAAPAGFSFTTPPFAELAPSGFPATMRELSLLVDAFRDNVTLDEEGEADIAAWSAVIAPFASEVPVSEDDRAAFGNWADALVARTGADLALPIETVLYAARMPRLDGRATGGRSHHRGDHSAAA